MTFKPATVSREEAEENLFPYKTELSLSTRKLFPYLAREGLFFEGMKRLRYVRNSNGYRSKTKLYGICNASEDKEARFLLTCRGKKVSLRSTNYHIIKGIVSALRNAAKMAATLDDL